MNLIKKQLKQSSLHERFATNSLDRFQEKVNWDAYVAWCRVSSAGELRPDTTPVVTRSLGEAAWELIKACTP